MVILYHCYNDSHISVSLSCSGGRLVCVRAISFLFQGQFWFSLPKFSSFGQQFTVLVVVRIFPVPVTWLSVFFVFTTSKLDFSACVNGGGIHALRNRKHMTAVELTHALWSNVMIPSRTSRNCRDSPWRQMELTAQVKCVRQGRAMFCFVFFFLSLYEESKNSD